MMSVRMPKSGILKPWMRSNEVSTRVTGWPTLTLMVSGVKSNFLAITLISFGVSAASRRAAPPTALPISSAVNTLRFTGSGLSDRQLGKGDLGRHRDVARAERLQRGVERRRRRALGRIARRGLREDQRLRRMMGDVAGHVMILLMD